MKKAEDTGKHRRVMEVVEVSDEPVEEKSPPAGGEKVAPPEEYIDSSPKEERKEFHENTVEPASELKKTEEEPPLTQKDLVSELFKPSEKSTVVGYPDISVQKKPFMSGLAIWVAVMVIAVGVIGYVIFSFS
jgi:hypothetical protein